MGVCMHAGPCSQHRGSPSWGRAAWNAASVGASSVSSVPGLEKADSKPAALLSAASVVSVVPSVSVVLVKESVKLSQQSQRPQVIWQ